MIKCSILATSAVLERNNLDTNLRIGSTGHVSREKTNNHTEDKVIDETDGENGDFEKMKLEFSRLNSNLFKSLDHHRSGQLSAVFF